MRFFRSVLIAACACGAAQAADAPPRDFPNKPLRFVTGFLPGGVSDTIARVVGEKLGEQLGQRVIIDGRPGAGGMLSMEIAATANPDGYTWYLGQPVITISPNFRRKLPVDPLRSFAPVSLLGVSPTLLVAYPALPFGSVRELIAYAKSRPEGLHAASSGPGTTNHLAGELFRVMAGIKLTSIQYKGAALTLLAAMSGEVQLTFSPLLAGVPQVKAGKVKAIAVTGAKRALVLPSVPTIAETLPGYLVEAWYGLLVPVRTPQGIVRYLNVQTGKALASAEVKDKLLSQGVEVRGTTPDDLARLISEDAARWKKLVTDAGLVLE